MSTQQKKTNHTTIDEKEINHFAKDSNAWWDENGPFKPLHRLNPLRMKYIKEQICTHFDRNFDDLDALDDLNIVDIGCGGGLACESLVRMGANVTGIDADRNAINTAQAHAQDSQLDIKYICGDAQNVKEEFDIVLALEVIEHVTDAEAFLKICKDKLKPNGLLIVSTLNRTKKSYALGIIAAEYILRWVPRGTHSWNKFVKPSEIAALTRSLDLTPYNITGLIFNPIKNEFELSETDLDVNYLMSLRSV